MLVANFRTKFSQTAIETIAEKQTDGHQSHGSGVLGYQSALFAFCLDKTAAFTQARRNDSRSRGTKTKVTNISLRILWDETRTFRLTSLKVRRRNEKQRKTFLLSFHPFPRFHLG